MGEEMADRLQRILQSLCYKTEWKYAVFWKLKHRARMILTWEDAYYVGHGAYDPSKNTGEIIVSNDALKRLQDGCCMGDPLGLAVAKMSYLVYSLGEGIIGQVAFTGKHQWIFADKPASSSLSSYKYSDGWQAQFSAGIKTIAIVAVVPHGVVQLGSLSTVVEDLKLVSHVKDVFGLLQNSSASFLSDYMNYTMRNIINPSELLVERSSLEVSNGFSCTEGQVMSNPDISPYLLHSSGKYNDLSQDIIPLRDFHPRKVVPVAEHLTSESPTTGNGGNVNHLGNTNLKEVGLPVEMPKVDHSLLPLVRDLPTWDTNNYDSFFFVEDEGLNSRKPLDTRLKNHLEKKPKSLTNVSCIDIVRAPLKFPAGCELQEALGSAFKKDEGVHVWSEAGMREIDGLYEPHDGVVSILSTPSCGSEHLLESVVANVCPVASNFASENSFCKSSMSLSTAINRPQSPNHIEHGSSGVGGQIQSFSFLAEKDNTPSICSGLSETQTEPAKLNRRRAKPGESYRPRPRDRQLIQDRVKELREIVPNGSKCSIDALLERTIKHMLFLQSVTSHADKLKRFAESKLHAKGIHFPGTWSNERNASWALEVGSQSKACPIILENQNMNGQMLVEMLCEECGLFLEIAEVLRGLGLTILKGVTESRADETWACFVVEGMGNRGLQRIDILWPLMRLLQPKAII
ncbi:transcription factor EMB1444-like isoform X2 [Tasmannia lanceolata]|uniref:transcription factor EMB1444-like isoform X2 n=1 Tax=Tasmannia lanceolata TaxID=3420 RepID=UPI0040646087